MDDIVFISNWIKDRVLGSGSFGTVVLWRHKKTEEKLAIKTCKWGDELTEKHKERWTKEVEMLQSCQNPNIVGTKELPPEFLKGLERANPSRLPILCMEYCSGGDLRQLLNKPESCGGLRELQVRQILSDVRNAMQFLHQNKITHRDLKPENVVMHVADMAQTGIGAQRLGKVVYKLIDLGYAKEIDSNSVCASFVGTLQYLAPEILYSKTYSNSVDFWSFGLLAFEIICGKRPFLPFMAPVQWMPHVKKKVHDNICVYETFHGDIEYSNEIFPENYISKPFKKLIEEWLRIALEYDPKLRGRDSPSRVTFNIPTEQKETASKVVLFDVLEKILAKKIIKIFSIATLSPLAYEIDETTTVRGVKAWIYKETKLPSNDQILICPSSYVELGNEENILKYWNDTCNTMLYLYSKSFIIKDDVKPIVPKAVQRCLEHPKAFYNFKNSNNLYKTSLYFVMSQAEMYDSLINGLLVRAESLKCEGRQLLLKHNSVDKSMGNLLAKAETLKKMVDIGKEHVNKLKESGTGTNVLGGFEKKFKDADDIEYKINKLQTAWNVLSTRLQSAKRRCNEIISDDLKNFVAKHNYQTIYANAFKEYIIYKKSEAYSENKGKEMQYEDIIKICYDCLKLRIKVCLEIKQQVFVLKLMDLSTEFSLIADIVTNAADNTDILANRVINELEELTDCTWTTVSILARDSEHLADIPYSVVSFEKRDFKIGDVVSNHCIKLVNKAEENDELKSIIEDSLKLRQNHVHLSQKLLSNKQMLEKSILDFSFLQDNN
ncbi:hypothetical protein K1T71_008430 [Dendrolimus kikuchii]|uniref:Uncharacterized protein n=1 Tax=Dendrolimus kikuchii TaxID=765133 RepID=A0ACC1CXE9_9NEOP|nr:hypothetical protein K1T71_008430 [Dendrolimus kikuchii]